MKAPRLAGRGYSGKHDQNNRSLPHPTAARNIDTLLARLEGVRQTGSDQWLARCPAHDDSDPSLSIRETGDGTILIHDFAGCSPDDITAAVGLELSDLFPPRPQGHRRKPDRRPFPAADILRCLTSEITFLIVIANDLERGDVLSDQDRERLRICASRFRAALGAGGIRHDG